MSRSEQAIQDRYDALLFAKTPELAREAARELVAAALGEEALQLPLQDALRQYCRRMRPAAEPRDQERFETEFIELVFWPNSSKKAA